MITTLLLLFCVLTTTSGWWIVRQHSASVAWMMLGCWPTTINELDQTVAGTLEKLGILDFPTFPKYVSNAGLHHLLIFKKKLSLSITIKYLNIYELLFSWTMRTMRTRINIRERRNDKWWWSEMSNGRLYKPQDRYKQPQPCSIQRVWSSGGDSSLLSSPPVDTVQWVDSCYCVPALSTLSPHPDREQTTSISEEVSSRWWFTAQNIYLLRVTCALIWTYNKYLS